MLHVIRQVGYLNRKRDQWFSQSSLEIRYLKLSTSYDDESVTKLSVLSTYTIGLGSKKSGKNLLNV